MVLRALGAMGHDAGRQSLPGRRCCGSNLSALNDVISTGGNGAVYTLKGATFILHPSTLRVRTCMLETGRRATQGYTVSGVRHGDGERGVAEKRQHSVWREIR